MHQHSWTKSGASLFHSRKSMSMVWIPTVDQKDLDLVVLKSSDRSSVYHHLQSIQLRWIDDDDSVKDKQFKWFFSSYRAPFRTDHTLLIIDLHSYLLNY